MATSADAVASGLVASLKPMGQRQGREQPTLERGLEDEQLGGSRRTRFL
jgi:hypothetical protein